MIESDDWGSIRMPSYKVWEELSKKNIDVHSNPFNKYDTLESAEDLYLLENLLENIYDKTGKKVIITANMVMANPDFEKIKKSDYQAYNFKDFRNTYIEYGDHYVWENFRKAIDKGYIKPQFHAREHLQVQKWLRLLRDKNIDLRIAFEYKVFSVDYITNNSIKENLMPSYVAESDSDNLFIINSIQDGLARFKDTFGYESITTIAPVGTWNQSHEECFFKNNVLQIQSFVRQTIPESTGLRRQYRYMGEINTLGIRYFPRNVYFEPSTNERINWISNALKQIALAFYFKKPAIVSTHRLNYVGGIDPSNRSKGLNLLDKLLNEVIRKWPDVQFISSDELRTLSI